MDTSQELIICGRKVGYYSVECEEETSFFAEKIGCVTRTHPKYKGPIGTITIDYGEGLIKGYDEEGNIISAVDLVYAIKDCPHSARI